jgi:hypothetical protein
VAVIFLAAFVLVPMVLGLLLPRRVGWIALAGVVPVAVEWIAAYRANLATGGGDWHSGFGLVVFTGLFACLLFILWAGVAMLAGWARGGLRLDRGLHGQG